MSHLHLLFTCFSVAAFNTPAIAQTLKETKPNVIIFLLDDLGYTDVGFNGGDIKTPNIDKLAAGGVKLSSFYVQPVCSPTRADKTRRTYSAMVHAVDEQIGRIVAELEKHGLIENTIIIFSSDNGGPIQLGATNGRLRAGKGTIYEGGVRSPAFVTWQGKLKAGTVNEPCTSLISTRHS
jgi:arylsulfatase A-like enzyme